MTIRSTVTPGLPKSYRGPLDSWQQSAHKWTIRLRFNGRTMTVPFFMGTGHPANQPPSVASVIVCMLTDSTALEMGFEDWCGEYGYDPDSRTAERNYKACLSIGRRLQRLLGDAYFEKLRYADEDEIAAHCA